MSANMYHTAYCYLEVLIDPEAVKLLLFSELERA